jgi:hypothetical protein
MEASTAMKNKTEQLPQPRGYTCLGELLPFYAIFLFAAGVLVGILIGLAISGLQ